MIDLNEFKEKAEKYFRRIMIEVMPQDVVEICDRAIAAESERDELKSKLAEIEKQVADQNEWIDSANGLFKMHSQVESELLAQCEQLQSQSIANNSEPAQRITEQDAREIVTSWDMLTPIYDSEYKDWLNERGRTLLDKLNEHREVTPNKAEVPTWQPIETIPVDRYVDVWLDVPNSGGGRRIPDICKSSTHSSGWIAINGNNPKYFTHWSYAQLQPLKGDDK